MVLSGAETQMTLAAKTHISIDSSGVARVDGTRMKVVHVVKEMLARAASVDQLREAFPDLSLAQIHAALAYYYDHQAQIDLQVRQESAELDKAAAQAVETPGREKLRRLGHRP